MSKTDMKFKEDCVETEQRHHKKLTNPWREERVPTPDCLINRSDQKLSREEENALPSSVEASYSPLEPR